MEFTFIGPEWGDNGDDDDAGSGSGKKGENGAAENGGGDSKPKSGIQLEGEAMVGELVAATEGLMCTMEVRASVRIKQRAYF